MTPVSFLDGRVTLHAGDSRDVLRGFPDHHFDSVATDPPYALVSITKRFGETSLADTTDTSARSRSGADGYARLAKGFMGKSWDNGETAFSVDFWREVLRVLKPGGHVVAFGGTRSYHRLACAIEDAGFEIRDQLAWCFGSGFPKSHSVDKALDSLEKNRWNNVAKAIDNLDVSIILRVWKELSESATPAAIKFQKSETAIGTNTPKSVFAHAIVRVCLNRENDLASAAIAELRSIEVPHISEGNPSSVQSNAERNFTESSALVSIAGLSLASLSAMSSGISIAHTDVRPTLVESITQTDKAAEALMIWLGNSQSSKQEDTVALCAALTDALKLITLSQSGNFRSFDTIQQTECVSATTAIITESTAALLISFTADIAKRRAAARAAGCERELGDYRSPAHAIKRKPHQERSHEGYHRPWQNDPKAVEATLRTSFPATDAAREWSGWGTALKPAWEPIVLARKPLGTGDINVRGNVERAIKSCGYKGDIVWVSSTNRGNCEPVESAESQRTLRDSSSIRSNEGTSVANADAASITPIEVRMSATQEHRPADGTPFTARNISQQHTTGRENSETKFSTTTGESALAAERGSPPSLLSTTSTGAAQRTGEGSAARFTTILSETGSHPDIESFAGIATGLTGSQERVLIKREGGSFVWPETLPTFVPSKPLNVAANVLRWGCGAINVDGCRVGFESASDASTAKPGGRATGKPLSGLAGVLDERAPFVASDNTSGRWPANLVLSYPEDEYALRRDITSEQRRELFGWLSENA